MSQNFYIKVPPHIAQKLQIADKPGKRLKDGNYMAFITHFGNICKLCDVEKVAPKIGCLVLKPKDMKDEVDGKVLRPLPAPTEPDFLEKLEAQRKEVR